MSSQLISIIISVIVDIFLLITLLFTKKENNKAVKYFILVLIDHATWIVANFLCDHPILSSLALFWNRLTFAIASIQIPLLLFALYFPNTDVKIKPLFRNLLIFFPFCISLMSLFTPLIIKDITVYSWGTNAVAGQLYSFFVIDLILYVTGSLVIIITKFRLASENERTQLAYMLAGLTITMVSLIVTGVALPYFTGYTKYGQFSGLCSIPFLALTTYSIIKYRLFNIKVIATETVVVLLSLGLIIDTFLSNSITEGILKGTIWLLATYGGWQLVKSVQVEIRQKEELAKLSKNLEHANEHLKSVDKLKDDFLSMASHELNTPIAAIKGYLSMILVEKMAGEIPEKARGYLQIVYTSADRLATMVKDLLNVSRIESNRIHIIWEQKPIEDIINQAIKEVMSKAREAKHTLTFEEPKHKMPETWFDITRITEILINILGNSIKYTPNGGKITVRVANDDDKLVVSVEDNGKGIPKERQHVVFEKFSQVDVLKDEVKGTGLGMYIAKKFIDLHHGKIWFHSDGADKGTTFFFSLPILKKKPYDPHEGEDAVLH